MAEAETNGTTAPLGGDIEMKEETAMEVSHHPRTQHDTIHSLLLQAPLDSIPQPTDPTDPQPPPQPQAPVEHLSTITQPPLAAATPPITSAPTTRPGSMPPQPSTKPEKPVAHGGPTRQYLNQNVTPHLLEAMKYLAAYEPEKPLLWLSEFLRDRSKEVEG